MAEYEDRQARRDKSFADRSASAADDFSMYLRDWIQQEVKALYPRIEKLADSNAPEPLKTDYQRAKTTLEDIDKNELNDQCEKFDKSIEDVRAGVYDDDNCLQALYYVQDALSGFERMVRRLQRLRKEVDYWFEPDPPIAGAAEFEG